VIIILFHNIYIHDISYSFSIVLTFFNVKVGHLREGLNLVTLILIICYGYTCMLLR
jgi:hypothetical protein